MTALTAEDAEDAELVARLRRGDAATARELYQRHGAALLRFGLAMGNSRQTAEDVVHDTFVEILRHPTRFDPSRGSVVAYLFGIARHRMSRIARTSQRLAPASLDDEGAREGASQAFEQQAAEHQQDAGDALDRFRHIERVRAAVFALPRVHREVIALCDLEELSYATAASILGCPIGTVRSRLSRARALLAARLAPQGAGDLTTEPGPGQADTPANEDEEDAPPAAAGDEPGVDEAAMTLSCRGTLT